MERKIFDFTGLKCPLPVLKARRALKSMAIGQLAEITADDPAAPIDFQHFCETSGHKLEQQSEQDGLFTFLIRKSTEQKKANFDGIE